MERKRKTQFSRSRNQSYGASPASKFSTTGTQKSKPLNHNEWSVVGQLTLEMAEAMPL